MNKWTNRDSVIAYGQGWNLFNVDGKGTLQLQRNDEMGRFESDCEVWEHVYSQRQVQNKLGELANKALGVLAENNPKEYLDIIKHCDPTSSKI